MIQRRSLLKGALAWPLATALVACSSARNGLRVKLLSQSVPVQIVSAFQRSLEAGIPMDFSSEANLSELFGLLQRANAPTSPKGFWHRSAPIPDLMTLGDAWLGDAIRQNLLQPWSLENLEGWSTLHDRYRQLVQRDQTGLIDSQGQIWGLPYRWGTTAIAYRRSWFQAGGWEPLDWKDLWRSELQGQIGLPEDPREVIGLALKSLGYSYNDLTPDRLPLLKDRLLALQQQVKFYSSTHLVQPLLVKDVALVVGWSTDLLPLANLDRDIRVILPESGTALWADLWIRPTQATGANLAAVQDWVRFCWSPEIINLFSEFGQGTSPLASPTQKISVLNPSADFLDRCEFLLPLPQSSQRIYQDLWQTMRRG